MSSRATIESYRRPMHSLLESSFTGGRIVARLGAAARLTSLLIAASLIAAACSGTDDGGEADGQSGESTVDASATGADGSESPVADADRRKEALASVGSGADIIALTALLPAPEDFGADWQEIGGQVIDDFFPCDKPPVQTSISRVFVSFSPDSLIPEQVNFNVIDMANEADAIEMFELLTGEPADACDLESADTLDAQLAASSGGAYTVDRSTIVGSSSEPFIDLPDGFDDLAGRAYEPRYLGDSGNIDLVAEISVLRRGTLVLVGGHLAPAGLSPDPSLPTIFVQLAEDLAGAGLGEPSSTDASNGELDAAASSLTAMMALDDEVPARFESLFLGELEAPAVESETETTCDEPDPSLLVAISNGPAWGASSGQVGEQILQQGHVFVSAESAKAYVDGFRDDSTCFAERNLLSRQQLQLPVTDVEVSLHSSMVDGIDVLEMRATGIQNLADIELDVVNSIFMAQVGNTVAVTLYIGLLDDEQQIAPFTASAAKRGGEAQ